MPSRRLPVSWDLEASIWSRATSQPRAGHLAGQPAGRLGSWPASLARPAGPAQPRQPAQSGRPARATKTPPGKSREKNLRKKFASQDSRKSELAFFSSDFSPVFFSRVFLTEFFSRFFFRIFFPDFFPGFFPSFFPGLPGFFPRIFPPDFFPGFFPGFFLNFFLICLRFFPRSHQVLDRGGFPSFLKTKSSDGNFLGAWGK